jgi:hypothetical protein
MQRNCSLYFVAWVRGPKMKAWKIAANVFAFVALSAVLARPADTIKITYVSFANPVEIPGSKVLPQGEYAFKMLDESSPFKVVQVFLALQSGTVGTPSPFNGNKPMTLVATLLTVPDYRNHPGRATVTYWRANGGGPNALRTVTFAPDPQALVVVYPRDRAADLAKAANQPAASMASQPSADVNAMKNATVKATMANGQDVEIANAFGKPGDRPADPPPNGKPVWGCNYEAGDVNCY